MKCVYVDADWCRARNPFPIKCSKDENIRRAIKDGREVERIERGIRNTFAKYAQEKGYEYVQVKTIQKGHYKEYDITNSFYEKLGFKELEYRKVPYIIDEAMNALFS